VVHFSFPNLVHYINPIDKYICRLYLTGDPRPASIKFNYPTFINNDTLACNCFPVNALIVSPAGYFFSVPGAVR